MTKRKAPEDKLQAGRPSKYQERYCDEVREFLKDGYSVAGFAGHIGVAVQTVKNWMAEHPEFLAAVKEAQAAATLWWERRARDAATTGTGNATTIIFGLKNRARDEWQDMTRHEVTGQDGGPIETHELTGKVAALPKEQREAIRAALKGGAA